MTDKPLIPKKDIRFNLGVSTLFSPSTPVDGIKKLLKKIPRIKVIEITLVDFPPQDSVTPLRKLARKRNLTYSVHLPFLYNDLAFPHPEIREIHKKEAKKGIDFANRIGAKFATSHPGQIAIKLPQVRAFSDFTISRKQYLEASMESLRELTNYATDKDVQLLVENLPGGLGITSEEINYFLSSVEGLGFNLDIGHAHITGNLNNLLSLPIYQIHVHDNDGTHDSHLPLNKGSIDLSTYFQQLRENKYDGNLVIEMYRLDDIKDSIKYIYTILKRLDN